MRSEGFWFLSGGLGAGPCSGLGNAFVHGRETFLKRLRDVCEVPDVLCPYNCPVSGLSGGSVTSLCRGDWSAASRVRCAVPLGLAGRASCG